MGEGHEKRKRCASIHSVTMVQLDDFFGPNAGYAAELFERYQRDPQSVDDATRALFARVVPPPAAVQQPITEELRPSPQISAAAAAASLAQGIRLFGHRAAKLDPLGSEPPGDPQLDYGAHGLTETDLARLPASVVGGPVAQSDDVRTAADAIHRLEQIYCGPTGYEFAHVGDPAERLWLLQAVEEARFRPPNDPIDERELLDRLTEVSAFERFLHRAYPGQTRFSVEGLGMLIPMLDELLADAAGRGTRTIVLGMAHRGRLNVLAHVLGKPYARILAEFEGREPIRRGALSESSDEGWSGDVKYHAGARRAFTPEASGTVSVIMAPNPSHLEFVNPVVQGMTRASEAAMGVLIHGDASFPGQGVVAESLNLSRLAGYRTAGTLHIIANNQLGFTTEPREDRSTLYASDLAKGFEIPIVHINADDPIACLAAVRLLVAYRAEFGKDALIDLIGYRRWGHNEGDDPSFTQPRMYATIGSQQTVREKFAVDLVSRGVIQPSDPDAFLKAGLDEFQRIRESVRQRSDGKADIVSESARVPSGRTLEPPTWDTLRHLNETLLTFPEGFTVHPKLERALQQRRRAAFDRPDAPIDWAHAEALAFATLLADGVPIRLTGQDTVRGTFSQRHLTFYDARTGQPFTPLAALPDRHAAFEVANSPLSEAAALGFEYGYSVQAPHTLVLWEAQYGDFINGAQVIVDEFVVSGQAKWGLVSGLVLLLPNAWEGQGPDHSSGRLERFLQLAAEDNTRVVYPSTAAQYFWLLRRQAAALAVDARPLIVMTPKSLLRHPLASSPARALTDGAFHPLVDDARARAHASRVRRLVLCSGHVWADLESQRQDNDGLAVVRLEELYPFPVGDVEEALHRYREAAEVVWLQEEPANMGAWAFVAPRLRDLAGNRAVRYIGRPERASPAEGWAEAHAEEQRRIVSEVFEGVAVHAS
jgi:2-oxoglutarate dehydrogenase E1 component